MARGAAYYGQVRRGQGIRIRGGTAQSYYVGIESSMPAVPGLEPPVQALCVAPFGMEEGSEAPLPPQQLGLVVGEAVRFRFFGSSVRREDQPGTLLDFWSPEELQELAQIEALLPAEGRAAGEVVPVQLRARVTEIGTLELLAEAAGGAQFHRHHLARRTAVGRQGGFDLGQLLQLVRGPEVQQHPDRILAPHGRAEEAEAHGFADHQAQLLGRQ